MATKKKGQLTPVADCLEHVYARKAWQGQWPLLLLHRRWKELFGPLLGEMSAPAFFRHDVLWVEVRSSVMMHHMQMLKPQLLEAIRGCLPDRQVEDLRWQLVHRVPEKEPSSMPKRAQVDPVEAERFSSMAAAVGDEACRQALCQLWQSFAANRGNHEG
ncbi:MAG: hypothetical protein CSA34_05880 [Desulfobulbus propionicus]|nr:MAG: hypothetical protein CSA34_05880 [Desulfobulbus propionicus]